ncbi:MAG TPA: hypothetical protein VIE39_00370 [Thermoanaerobaculia bacterium]|jgi:hypothetical protein
MTNENCAPIACTLASFDAEARREHHERTRRLLSHVKFFEELPDGWRFTLPPVHGLFREAVDWVLVERKCCPFLSFDFRIEDPRDPFSLAVRGPEGGKQALEAELGELAPWARV